MHPGETLAVLRDGKPVFYKVGPLVPLYEELPPFKLPRRFARGFDYDTFTRFLGEGHYTDD